MLRVVYVQHPTLLDGIATLPVGDEAIDVGKNADTILAWLSGGVNTPTFDAFALRLGITYSQLSRACSDARHRLGE